MTPAHGTPAGYRAHLRKKEEPCRKCMDVNSASSAAWRRKHAAGNAHSGPSSSRDALMDDYPAMTLGEWARGAGYDPDRRRYA